MLVLPTSSDSSVPFEGLDKIVIDDDDERYFQIGNELPSDEKEELMNFLRGNLDVFNLILYEAAGVNPEFICHNLNVNPKAISKKR